MEARLLWYVLILGLLGAVACIGDSNETLELTTEDNVESFEEMEKNFKLSVQSMVKKLMPYLVRGSSEAQISGQCTSSLMRVISGIRQIREWAMRFIDATGKLPPGVLEGTSLSIGDYDECLDIVVGKKDEVPQTPAEIKFRGQYCLLEAHRPESINRAVQDFQNGNTDSPIAKTKTFLNMFVRYKHLRNSTFKLGLCVPSKCSREDVEKIFSGEMFKFAGKITVPYCKIKGGERQTVDQIFLLCLFGFAMCILLLTTSVDAFLRIRGEDISQTKSLKKKYLYEISRGLSIYSNAIEVLDTSKFHEPIKSLCGLRTIIVILTIYSHTYGHIHALHFQKFTKPANFVNFFESFVFAGIANGSVGMDTVIFIAGIMITYSRWRNAADKEKVKLGVVKLFLQRYFRMTAAQLLAIAFFILITINGSGPIWSAYADPMIKNCRERWWWNILYVHNCLKTTEVVIDHFYTNVIAFLSIN